MNAELATSQQAVDQRQTEHNNSSVCLLFPNQKRRGVSSGAPYKLPHENTSFRLLGADNAAESWQENLQAFAWANRIINMRFFSSLSAALALTVTVGLSAAQAVPVIFDFQNGINGANGTYGPLVATQGGITVTATGGIYSGLTDTIINTNIQTVTKTNTGLGVDCVVVPAFCDNQIDGDGLVDDLLTLTFSEVVDFTSVFFRLIEANDDFDLWIDGILVSSDVTIQGNNPYSLTGLTGTSISFGADARNDDFRLGSITVDTIPAPVPLPAGGILLVGALGGLAALRRKPQA